MRRTHKTVCWFVWYECLFATTIPWYEPISDKKYGMRQLFLTDKKYKPLQNERRRSRPRYYLFHHGGFLLKFSAMLRFTVFPSSHFQRERPGSVISFRYKLLFDCWVYIVFFGELTQYGCQFFGTSSHLDGGTHFLCVFNPAPTLMTSLF